MRSVGQAWSPYVGSPSQPIIALARAVVRLARAGESQPISCVSRRASCHAPPVGGAAVEPLSSCADDIQVPTSTIARWQGMSRSQPLSAILVRSGNCFTSGLPRQLPTMTISIVPVGVEAKLLQWARSLASWE